MRMARASSGNGQQEGMHGKFQRHGYTCGGWDHRGAECATVYRAYAVEHEAVAENIEKTVSSGGVWTMGELKNRFEALDEEIRGPSAKRSCPWASRAPDTHVSLQHDGAMMRSIGEATVCKREITVDSGAEESVWPSGWLEEEPTITTGVEAKRFIATNV